MLSKAYNKVGPLYHGRLADFSIMLSPCHPEIGTNWTSVLTLYPILVKYDETSLVISLNLSSE
jgi:hypothetical protein